MTNKIAWSTDADKAILHMRAAGSSWHSVAGQLRVGRNSVIERARRLGLPPMTRTLPRPPRETTMRTDRAPLPAGHPTTWSAITAATTLEGAAYPYPVFL